MEIRAPGGAGAAGGPRAPCGPVAPIDPGGPDGPGKPDGPVAPVRPFGPDYNAAFIIIISRPNHAHRLKLRSYAIYSYSYKRRFT